MSATIKTKLEFDHDGQVARVVLAAPKANIVDQTMMAELESAFDRLAARRDLKAIVLTGEGPNFSFGASVQEHLPEQISGTLTRLHALLRQIAEAPAPTIAAVRGQCLGGGFELALVCDLILAEETAQLGCPEIQLGVFPPAASALLPVRIGAGPAAGLVLTGSTLTGTAAAAVGLVNRCAAPGQLEASACGLVDCRLSASLGLRSALRGDGRAPSSDACAGAGLTGTRAALLAGPDERARRGRGNPGLS